jgi:hypothetical protein
MHDLNAPRCAATHPSDAPDAGTNSSTSRPCNPAAPATTVPTTPSTPVNDSPDPAPASSTDPASHPTITVDWQELTTAPLHGLTSMDEVSGTYRVGERVRQGLAGGDRGSGAYEVPDLPAS